jgi:hypothetical protein
MFVLMNLELLPGRFAICRLDPGDSVPQRVLESDFFFVARNPSELSIVVDEADAPDGIYSVRGYSCIRVQGPLEFGLTGVLASLAHPLAEAGIPIFALSTWETDFLLLQNDRLEDAIAVPKEAGHRFV